MQHPAHNRSQQSPPKTPPERFSGLIAVMRLLVVRLLRGQPVREAARLGLRLIGARIMSVLTLIVAAWMVDIEAFAEFGVYQTLAALALIALFLRYDAAILAARTEAEAGEALRLSTCIGAILWLVFAACSLVAGASGLMRLPLAMLLPFSILARGMLSMYFARTTRDGDFTGIGRASLVHAVVQPMVLLALVLSPVEDITAFAVADVAGHFSAVAYLAWRRRHRSGPLWRDWSLKTLVAAAKRWKSLPLYNLPSSFFSRAFVMSPLLIMPMIADAVFAGHAALAYRIFDVPTQIIMAASTPIFLNRLKPSEERTTPIFERHIMLGLIVLLGLGYALMTSILVLADPWFQNSELDGLAEVIPLIAIFQLFIALAAPLSDSCSLYMQQRSLVVIQAASLLAGFAIAVLSQWISPEGVLVVLAAVSAFRALALGELLRKLSRLNQAVSVTAPLIS